ncbi:hypothetical protein ACRAKI_12430 [Saccharothrix isguenensis]
MSVPDRLPRHLTRGRGRLSRMAAVMAAVVLGGVTVVFGSATSSAATVDTNAWYVPVNRASGKALDVYNLATNDGARITQWTRGDGDCS